MQQLSALVSQREALEFSEEELEAALHHLGSTGCGSKYRGARGQPLTRGPEADETKTMAVTLPHRV